MMPDKLDVRMSSLERDQQQPISQFPFYPIQDQFTQSLN